MSSTQTKLAAALSYVEVQVQPIVDLVSDDISSIISSNYLVLLIIVLIAVIAIVLWICAARSIEAYITFGIILLLIIVAGAAFLAFRSYVRAATQRVLQGVVASLTNGFTEAELLAILNNAAQEYLGAIQIMC